MSGQRYFAKFVGRAKNKCNVTKVDVLKRTMSPHGTIEKVKVDKIAIKPV
jgi:hypothetical protein